MKQVNLNVTPEFERDLKRYMKLTQASNKSEAIRRAVREAANRAAQAAAPATDFHSWIGLALQAPLRPGKFKSHDELWS